MIETLIFWMLAMIGAATIVFYAVKRLQRSSDGSPVSVIFIVQDEEKRIEGLLRRLLIQFALTPRQTSVVIIDTSDGTETGEIVQRLAVNNARIVYKRLPGISVANNPTAAQDATAKQGFAAAQDVTATQGFAAAQDATAIQDASSTQDNRLAETLCQVAVDAPVSYIYDLRKPRIMEQALKDLRLVLS